MPRHATQEAKSLGAPPQGVAVVAAALTPLAAAPARWAVRAPLSGVVIPLDAVPDPVFSGRMAGDGVAIDPTSSEVLAPFAGRVTQLHDAHHALAITSDQGLEVLIHVGLETVVLKGRGFTALVKRGERVEPGQPVLRFDPELLAREARSLITVVLATAGAEGARLACAHGLVEAGRSVLLTVEPGAASAEPRAAATGEAVLSDWLPLPNHAGLHARPAAVLASEAKKYHSTLRLLRGGDEVNAKSVVAVLGLSTRKGDLLRFKATGPDAVAAVAALSRLLASGSGEKAEDAPVLAAPFGLVAGSTTGARRPGELAGVGAAPGLALGRAFQFRRALVTVAETGGSAAEEQARFDAAVRKASAELQALRLAAGAGSQAQILGVLLALLDDPELLERTQELLALGKSAAFSWREAFTAHAATLEKLDNPLLRERAADLRDVGRRLLASLAEPGAAPAAPSPELPEGAILIADELTPSEFSALAKGRLLGLCTTTGGATSHLAILARAANLPAVCGADLAALSIADGVRVVLDGTRGLLRVDPDASAVAAAEEQLARQTAQRASERAAAFTQAHTKDGHRVEVAANIRDLAEAQAAVAAGAEGVGLLRSEFMFEDRPDAPGEDEQALAYRSIAEVLGPGRPFVVRTLDVGGDKPLAWLPLPKEDNPFLGLRGVRLSLAYPELFRTQLRAILRAAPVGNLHVMFPMIAGLDEVRAAKAALASAQAELAREQPLAAAHTVKVGVMIEVPSAALLAEALAREVDFFSIGTNDLTQYTLAMDRGNQRMAKQADALHPAVLRLIAMTVEGAHRHGKWVGVCGGLASDPLAVPVLTGLGVDELSVSVPAIASVKAALARWTLPGCKALAAKLLAQGTAAEVRALLIDNPDAR